MAVRLSNLEGHVASGCNFFKVDCGVNTQRTLSSSNASGSYSPGVVNAQRDLMRAVGLGVGHRGTHPNLRIQACTSHLRGGPSSTR